MDVTIPIAVGELIDKITILQIKAARMTDPAQLANVARELAMLEDARKRQVQERPEFGALQAALRTVNERLWDIEDRIREHERDQRFDAAFVELARSVYFTNDERARLKRAINELAGSAIVEEKSYADYRTPGAPKPKS